MEEEKINPGHRGIRDKLRVIGPMVFVVGIALIIFGIVNLVMGGGSFGSAKYVLFVFAGMPLLFVGSVMSMYGYMGKVARYAAGEMAPVGKDTFNYVADGTQEGVKAFAGALGEGLSEGLGGGLGVGAVAGGVKVRCHKCNELLEDDAKFCSGCGAAITKSKACPKCSELNDPDAKFCDNCGHRYDG